jgi:hypothetical protein
MVAEPAWRRAWATSLVGVAVCASMMQLCMDRDSCGFREERLPMKIKPIMGMEVDDAIVCILICAKKGNGLREGALPRERNRPRRAIDHEKGNSFRRI